MPTTDELQTQLTALAARVDLLDGINLAQPSSGFTAVTNAKISGLKADVKGLALTMESIRAKLQATMDQWIGTLKSVLGLP